MELKTISEKIWELEKSEDLFSKKIGDVYFWKIIRFELIKKITREKKVFGQDHTINNQSFISKIKYAISIMLNQKHSSAFTRKDRKEILIFDHPRKVLANDKYIDIYTQDFIETLDEDKYEVIERSNLRKHWIPTSKNRSYEEYISVFDFFKYVVIGVRLRNDEKKFISNLEFQINSIFGLNIDLEKFVKKHINTFCWKKAYYIKLLKTRQPQKIYLVVSYGLEALISASRESNIETIEFQHGTMSKYHLGYSFPNNEEVPYFPDKILLFGKFWEDSTPLPIKGCKKEYYGFPYLRKNLNKYKAIKKEKNTVLFISQGTIGNDLSRYALDLAINRKDLKIIYKLHPGEFTRWKEEYPDLVSASKLANFIVLEKSKLSIHELQATSEFQVGVYSTAIYEGIIMDCITILIKLNGIEYMEFLIENDFVKIAENSNQLEKYLCESNHKTLIDKNYFFSGIKSQNQTNC